MSDEIKIRNYKRSDKLVLLEILKLNVPKYFAESEINDFDDYLENKREKYFVAELKSKIIGAGGINFDKINRIGKISWDFIEPNFHGKGVGKKLLKHRIKLLNSMDSIEKNNN